MSTEPSRADEREDSPWLPEWLRPLRDRIGDIRAEDLTAYVPPKDLRPREGAVLVLFGDGPDGPDLLLTERAHTMRSQPGQVSFPGGSLDEGEDAVQAALREAHEEVGVDPDGVDVFAQLPRLWIPPRNFAITPVLAYWRHDAPLSVVNELEVHAVFRVPIADLLDPAQRFWVQHPLGWKGPGWLIGPERDVLLWGFTAGVINAMFDFVGWTRPWQDAPVRGLPEQMIEWNRVAELLGIDVPEGQTFDPYEAGLIPDPYDEERPSLIDRDVDRDPRPSGDGA